MLRGALAGRNVGAAGLVADSARPTTRKVRVVTDRHQQVARLDYERDDEAPEVIEAELIAMACALAATAGAIVVSDYLKGAVTVRLVAELAEVARQVATCRCWSIRRFRTSGTTAARRW